MDSFTEGPGTRWDCWVIEPGGRRWLFRTRAWNWEIACEQAVDFLKGAAPRPVQMLAVVPLGAGLKHLAIMGS